jgi:hypothetical protein
VCYEAYLERMLDLIDHIRIQNDGDIPRDSQLHPIGDNGQKNWKYPPN